MEAKSWIKRVAGVQPATVAKAIGMSTSTFDSQMKAGLKPETVVKIARQYDVDVIASLVELGLISADEAGGKVDLSEIEHLAWLQDEKRATDDVLLTEIGRRLRARGDEQLDPAAVTPITPKPAPERTFPTTVNKAARPKRGKPKIGD